MCKTPCMWPATVSLQRKEIAWLMKEQFGIVDRSTSAYYQSTPLQDFANLHCTIDAHTESVIEIRNESLECSPPWSTAANHILNANAEYCMMITTISLQYVVEMIVGSRKSLGTSYRSERWNTKLQLTPKSVTLTHRSGVPIPHRHQALTQSNQ